MVFKHGTERGRFRIGLMGMTALNVEWNTCTEFADGLDNCDYQFREYKRQMGLAGLAFNTRLFLIYIDYIDYIKNTWGPSIITMNTVLLYEHVVFGLEAQLLRNVITTIHLCLLAVKTCKDIQYVNRWPKSRLKMSAWLLTCIIGCHSM